MPGFLRKKAFTLIELMVAVAIVAILATYGLPAYQLYTRKAHVAEAFSLVKPIQDQITNNALNGRPLLDAVTLPTVSPSSWISSFTVSPTDGYITVLFKPSKFDGNSYYLSFVAKDMAGSTILSLNGTATDSTIPSGKIQWGCRSAGTTGGWTPGTLPAQYAPQSCIGDPYH